MKRLFWLVVSIILASVGVARAGCPNGAVVNLAADGYGGACIAGFAPNGTYMSPLSVSTSSAEIALPAGVVVAASNPGANPEWVNLGTSSGVTATTADIYIPAGCTVPLAVGANTNIAAISTGGSTTLNLAAGSGLFAPFCSGGSGGGGGGSVTQGTSPWVTSQAATTPAAGAASAIVTGGTAVTLITGPVNGCYVVNPLLALDQNIPTAEVAYVNPTTTATSNGRGTNTALQPGQSYSCPKGMTTNLSALAATTGHALSVVKW